MHYKDSHEFILYARFLDEECQHRVKKRQKKNFSLSLPRPSLSLSLFLSLSLSYVLSLISHFSLSLSMSISMSLLPPTLSLSLTLFLSQMRDHWRSSAPKDNRTRAGRHYRYRGGLPSTKVSGFDIILSVRTNAYVYQNDLLCSFASNKGRRQKSGSFEGYYYRYIYLKQIFLTSPLIVVSYVRFLLKACSIARFRVSAKNSFNSVDSCF